MVENARGSRAADPRLCICFVALNSYNVLSGRADINHIGGSEVQQVRIASWLAEKGHRVSFITLDHGQPDGIDIRGIKVYKAYSKPDGIRGLRFMHPRWSGLWAAMARANADIYYHRCAEAETGQVALWCRLHGRKFVFASAHDSNCDPQSFAAGRSWVERSLYRVGIRLADAVTAQTETQRDLFRRNMGVETRLVRNCGPDVSERPEGDISAIWRHLPVRVLWIGRISTEKRLEWLLDAAEQCPDIVFEVVGTANMDSPYSSSLVERARGIPNVKLRGWVPHAEMSDYYRQCRILCCTSASEGFPNTFLEAWGHGMPVISTFDPDGVVRANGLGHVVRSVGEIVTCLQAVIQSPEEWLGMSTAARRFYLAHYTPAVCLPVLERLLRAVAGEGQNTRE